MKKPKAVLSRNKKIQGATIADPAKSKTPVTSAVKMSLTTSKSVHKGAVNDPVKSKTSVTSAVNDVKNQE